VAKLEERVHDKAYFDKWKMIILNNSIPGGQKKNWPLFELRRNSASDNVFKLKFGT